MVDLASVKSGDTIFVGAMGFVVDNVQYDAFSKEYLFRSHQRVLFSDDGSIAGSSSGNFSVVGDIVDDVRLSS